MKRLAIGLLGLLGAWPLLAQDAMQGLPSASAEYQRIAAERARENTLFDAQEAACYQRFAVNNCLADVQSRRRAMVADFKRQEASLHDAERLQKGAERLRASEQKALEKQQQDVEAGKSAAAPQERLQAQQEKQAAHPLAASSASTNRVAPSSSGPSAAEQARQRASYAAKQAQAEKKRQEIARRLKEKSSKPVPGLPVPD